MPTNPERRTQILDAAIDILCDDGVGGLTHRQVDSRAGVPAGTTSNYFRTRQALLEATAARTVDLHWQRVEALQSAIGPLSRDGLKALMVRMLEPDEQFRRWTLARFELFMESTRRAELRPLMAELQAAAVKSATLIIEAAGFDPDAGTDGRAQQVAQRLCVQQPHHRTRAGRARYRRSCGPTPEYLPRRLVRRARFLNDSNSCRRYPDWSTGTNPASGNSLSAAPLPAPLSPKSGTGPRIGHRMRWNPADTPSTSVVGFEVG